MFLGHDQQDWAWAWVMFSRSGVQFANTQTDGLHAIEYETYTFTGELTEIIPNKLQLVITSSGSTIVFIHRSLVDLPEVS